MPLSPRKDEKLQLDEKAELELVNFTVAEESFAIDIYKIVEITRIMEITKLPKSLPFIEGVVNLRNRVIPVLDLRKRLGFPEVESSKSGRIIITRVENWHLGLLVDSISRVIKIPEEAIEKVPPSTLQINEDLIDGVGHLEGSLVIILNLEEILTPQEKRMLTRKKRERIKKKL